jgi:hypothetical protein
MTYQAAEVALVGAVALLNLVLTFGVIRRLRDHEARLSVGPGATAAARIGQPVGDFRTVSLSGRPVDAMSRGGRRLVGFMKPDCQPCKEQLADFVALAARWPGGRDRVLAVISGTTEQAEPFADQLCGVAEVVIEPPGGSMAQAFGVHGFPAYVHVDANGLVVAAEHRLSRLDLATAHA